MENKRPLILVSNDDGIMAKGISELVKFLRPLGEIVVMAPDSPRSGSAPWAVLLIGEGYASAVRLAAAIMPARLAGVEPVFAVWTGAETAPSGLFAALELTGVEQVFAMRDPAPLLRELPGRGRILRFGKAPLPECPCPVWSDRAPRIERTALPDTAVLWAHPDALPADDGADVVYAGQIIIGEDTPLVLGAGLEGCWLHTGLTPDFFMNERLALSALKLES